MISHIKTLDQSVQYRQKWRETEVNATPTQLSLELLTQKLMILPAFWNLF